MNDNFDKEINNSENNGGAVNGNENAENIQIREEKGEQIPKEETNTADQEEKTASSQEENIGQEENTADKNGDGSTVNQQRAFSANYEPPNYTPNFTVWEAPKEVPKQQKPQKPLSVGVVITICAITVMLSILLGTVAGAIAGNGLTFDLGAKDKHFVNIVRSDREIVVEEVEGNTGYNDLSVADVAARVGESVVEITTAQKQAYGSYIQSGAGSGVIFDKVGDTGYIVTNYHVVSGADDITVRIKKGDEYVECKATYVAGDVREDIAVLTVIVSHPLTPVVFAQGDKIKVGEEVVAIGNPLGTLGGTVTNGIISALDREIIVGDSPMTLLQTNAAINPGNSGGGLFNMSGELVGIVNAKQSSSGIEGLGFAIPIDIVSKDIKDLCEHGYIRGRAALGISTQESSSGNPLFGYTTGLYVVDGGNSGLQKGDRILKVNGVEVSNISDCYTALKQVKIGDSVVVTVERYNVQRDITVTTVEYKPATN